MEKREYTNIHSFEHTHWWYVSTHHAVWRELDGLPPGSKVLDAGCGTGGLLRVLNEKFEVTGLDASRDAVEAARPQAITQGEVEAIPFRTEDFDAVTCIDVLYHQKVGSEVHALKEFWRVLKRQGTLVIQVPAFECLRGGHDEVVHTRRRYRLEEVRSLLDRANFGIVHLRYRYPWLFIPALVIRRMSRNTGRSDLRPAPRLVNRMLIHLSNWADSPVLDFMPLGTSVFAVARKR